MVFSIIFRKPFQVITNEERGASRFESLLTILGLEGRLLRNSYKESICWNESDAVLREMQTKSISFLVNALQTKK
jgi:hypothetical protein